MLSAKERIVQKILSISSCKIKTCQQRSITIQMLIGLHLHPFDKSCTVLMRGWVFVISWTCGFLTRSRRLMPSMILVTGCGKITNNNWVLVLFVFPYFSQDKVLT